MTEIFDMLNTIQESYSTDDNHTIVLQCMLDQYIQYTESKNGFIASIHGGADTHYLKIQVWSGVDMVKMRTGGGGNGGNGGSISDDGGSGGGADIEVNSNDSSEINALGYALSSMGTLIEKVHSRGTCVIDNKVAKQNGPRVPLGHPRIRKFLGIPLKSRDRVIGLIILGNRKHKYHTAIAEALNPVTQYCAIAFKCMRNELKILNTLTQYDDLRIMHKTTNAQYRAIVDNATDSIIIIKRNGEIMHFNNATYRMLGFSSGDINNLNITDLIPASCWKTCTSTLVNRRSKQKCSGSSPARIQMNTKTDIKIPVDVSIFAIDGDSYGAIIRDARESIFREKEMKKLASEKSQFLANMSHEIRTPLNGILGTMTLLADTPMSEIQLEYISIIKQSGSNLMTIINDILDMSKLEARKMAVLMEPTSIRSCVESVCDILSSRAEEKHINLNYSVSEEVPNSIVGDAVRIKQVLMNLLNNAIKFTEKGSVLLNVDAIIESNSSLSDSTTPYDIIFTVTDTGIGITKDIQRQLFRPFTQADQSNTRAYQGTGLGLAISRQLAQLMGGDCWIEHSVIGGGSTFKFNMVADLDLKYIPEKIPANLKGKNILVVDDNQINLVGLCGILLKWGIHPTSCASAELAMVYIRSGQRFDLALIDICMPNVGGVELAEKIHNIDKNLQLIAISSISVLDVKSDDFIKVLPKPIGEQKLYKAISGLFGTPRPNRRRASNAILTTSLSNIVNFNILVAEDIETNRKVIMGMLKRLNYDNITIVANGKLAVDEAVTGKYQLILMDIKMPVMGGYDASKIITREMGKKRPPIIALTAIAMVGDKETFLSDGYMDEYITKPIDINELGKKIKLFT